MAPIPGVIVFDLARYLLAPGNAVSDAELERAVKFAAEKLKLLVEPGGAAALWRRCALASEVDVKDKAVALVLSKRKCGVCRPGVINSIRHLANSDNTTPAKPFAALAAMLAWAAGLALSFSFWPGIMVWDSGRQYGQALSGRFDDWHPPLMEWIWRLSCLDARSGTDAGPAAWPCPLPHWVFWRIEAGGEAAQAETAWLAATGLFPPTLLLMATIIKDSLMAAMLLAAFALLVRFSRYRQQAGALHRCRPGPGRILPAF